MPGLEDHKFEASVGYKLSLRPASKEKKKIIWRQVLVSRHLSQPLHSHNVLTSAFSYIYVNLGNSWLKLPIFRLGKTVSINLESQKSYLSLM